MAINWLIALKAVPWTDLVQAAPTIVKGARKLYTTVRGGAGETTSGRPTERTAAGGAGGVEDRLLQLEERCDALAGEQEASAELIRKLAEQNARLIEAVSIMRARARLVFGACILSWVGMIVLVIWLLSR